MNVIFLLQTPRAVFTPHLEKTNVNQSNSDIRKKWVGIIRTSFCKDFLQDILHYLNRKLENIEFMYLCLVILRNLSKIQISLLIFSIHLSNLYSIFPCNSLRFTCPSRVCSYCYFVPLTSSVEFLLFRQYFSLGTY